MFDKIEAIQLNLLLGIKVGKTIDKKTREKLLNEVSKKISELNHTETQKEIYKRLTKINKIGKLTRLNRPNTWMVDGTYSHISKNIYIVEKSINNAIEGKIDRTTMHEFIHVLQNGRIFFRGKRIKGIVEGCTESYTNKIFKQQRATLIRGEKKLTRVNHPPITAYMENMSIVNQLDIVLGGEFIEKLALQGKPDALQEIIKQYGKNFYEKIRKGTEKMLKLNKIDDKIMLQQKLQNTILTECYGKKYQQIQTIQDAVRYFEELKQIELERYKTEEDTIFVDFYCQKHSDLMQRFLKQRVNTEKLETLKYSKAKFYPISE